MYEKLGITENHLQALALFTRGFFREYYIREVQKILKISPRTAQLILDALEKKAVLESAAKGKIRTYRIKGGEAAKDYFILVEQYRKIAFLEKNIMVREIITKITPFIEGIGVIFGSYAKGAQGKNSDLDIFVAGRYDKEGIENVSETYGIEINVKSCPVRAFEKGMKTDILIREVLGNHIIFLNAEKFVGMVLENGKA